MAEPSPSAMTPPPGGGDADTAPRWQGPALGDVVFGRRAGREPSVRSILRVIVTVVGSALALYIVYRLRTPISYLLFATFIAVALSAPVAWLSQRMPKGLAITIVYLAVVLVPIGVGAILIPPLVRAAADLVGNFPSYVDDLKQTVSENDTLQNLNDNFDVTTKLEEFATNAASKLDDVASVLADVGAGIVGSVFAGVTILIMSLFMVSRGGKWIDMALSTRPPREAEVIKRALDNMSVAVGAYVGGAILQSLIAGVVTFIVLSILGVPAPLALAVVVAVLDLIPLVGATLGAILVGIVTLFVDFPSVTIIWIVWAILYQQFENYVIQPRIQGRMVQLDPFIIVIAALFGGTLIGIVGALVAIPVAGAAQIGVREFITYRREALLAQREEEEAAGIDGPPGNGDPPGGEEPPDGGGPPDSGSGSGPEGEPAPA
jgi:predicted PurR-regulated permease PerM